MKEGNGWVKVESGTLSLVCNKGHRWQRDISFLSPFLVCCPECGGEGTAEGIEK